MLLPLEPAELSGTSQSWVDFYPVWNLFEKHPYICVTFITSANDVRGDYVFASVCLSVIRTTQKAMKGWSPQEYVHQIRFLWHSVEHIPPPTLLRSGETIPPGPLLEKCIDTDRLYAWEHHDRLNYMVKIKYVGMVGVCVLLSVFVALAIIKV